MHNETPLKIHFADFWPSFHREENSVFSQLFSNYNIILDDKSPDYVIFSVFGCSHLDYDCVKIFYTGENQTPDFNLCDYAIGFDYIDFGDRYIRFPLFALEQDQLELAARPIDNDPGLLEAKTGFCNFIYSNTKSDPARGEFFKLLSGYKRIDSPGLQLNNMTTSISRSDSTASSHQSKLDFQSQYKFSIAFENACSPGYTTEKILHAFAANTIPIYWGDPRIAEQFNPGSFINCHDFDNFENAVNHVIELDNNNQDYLKMLCSPCFESGVIPGNLKTQHLLNFFENIFKQPLDQARRRSPYGRQKSHRQLMSLALKTLQKRQGRSLSARLKRNMARILQL